jgi:2-methylcitrate dehydratase PrpD
MSTAATKLAGFASGLQIDDVPTAVTSAAKLHLLDALGCGLAALGLGNGDYVRVAAAEEEGQGPASAIGVAGGVPTGEAAIVNGTLCHALDFDDTHSGAVAHVTVAVAPAALAEGQAQAASGAELLTALVAGSEVTIRLGAAAGTAFHARGFHPTAVCGAFGAAAAAARLRGLDAATTARALGIAGSMASGVLEFLADGSDTKRLHPGWAACAGLQAARLAAYGASGPTTIIEGDAGLYATHLGRRDIPIERELSDLGSRWETPNIAFKPFPACHYLHASVDASAEAAGGRRLQADDVEEIVAEVPEAATALVLEPVESKLSPRSDYEAKFSLQYSVAAMLVHGQVDVTTYTDRAITDPEVLELARLVKYRVRDFPTADHAFPGAVRIRLRNGEELAAELPHQRGAPEYPMTEDEVREKLRTNAALALPADARSHLEAAIMEIEQEDDLDALRVLAEATAREEAVR